MSLFGSFKRKPPSPTEPVKAGSSRETNTLALAKPSAPEHPVSAGGGQRRMLIVSATPAALANLQGMLQPLRGQWELVSAGSAPEALAAAAAAPVAGVICDAGPPGTDWTLLLDQFAASHPTTLRFLRCGPQSEGAVKDVSAGGVAWLSTALDAAGLAEAVARVFQVNAWIPDVEARKLVVQMKRLPSLPTLYNQVVAELSSQSGSLDFVGKLIAKDPGITAKILQMVNSPVFGLGHQITDPAEAVMFLGGERTKGMLLASSVFLHFDKSQCSGFSHEQLWQHSLAVASFATAITLVETKDKKLSELAYTTALLHDVGKLLLAANIPEDYSRVLDQAKRREVPIEQVELEALGTSHAELAAAVLGNWGLPFPMLEAIGWHHVPLRSGDETFTPLTAVHIADAIDHERQDEKAGRRSNRICRDYIESLGLSHRRNPWRAMFGCAPKTDLSAAAEKLLVQREVREFGNSKLPSSLGHPHPTS